MLVKRALSSLFLSNVNPDLGMVKQLYSWFLWDLITRRRFKDGVFKLPLMLRPRWIIEEVERKHGGRVSTVARKKRLNGTLHCVMWVFSATCALDIALWTLVCCNEWHQCYRSSYRDSKSLVHLISPIVYRITLKDKWPLVVGNERPRY